MSLFFYIFAGGIIKYYIISVMKKSILTTFLLVCILTYSFIPCFADNNLRKNANKIITNGALLSSSFSSGKPKKKEQKNKEFQIGVELGGNMSSMITSKDYQNSIASKYGGDYKASSGFGFQGGLYGDFNLSEKLFLEFGLYFIQRPGKENVDYYNSFTQFDLTVITTKNTEINYNPIFIQIPILFKVNFPLSDNSSINLKAGPYFSFGFLGKIKSNTLFKVVTTGIGTTEKETSTNSDYFVDHEKSDIGLKAGVGFDFSKITCGLFVDYGLMNTLMGTKENISAHSFSLGLNVGYKF